MKRPLAPALPVTLAACFSLGGVMALSGCTIYTYDTPPPKHHKPKPAATATTTAAKPGAITLPGKTATVPGTKVAPSSDAPTVTSSTIFGGNNVSAFHGLLYVIPEGTTKMPTLGELVPFGQLYTDQFMVSPQTFSGGF